VAASAVEEASVAADAVVEAAGAARRNMAHFTISYGSNMRQHKVSNEKSYSSCLINVVALAFLLTGCIAVRSVAEQAGQQVFSSPEEAAQALATAAQGNDTTAMLSILGPEGKQVVSSGDPTEDAENHANFAKKYQEMHRIVKEPDGTSVLYIGAENWPAPIPLVHKGNTWYFDTAAGEAEIVYRRVGHNELSTIRVCQELSAAQKEYFSEHKAYAPQIFSDEGQQNGLYWKTGAGEPQSPIGPLVAAAVAEGYVKGRAGPPTPYRGYLYHVLTRQGKHAHGGAKNYIVNGKMTEGFAFVAYPAEYRSSGVMTFVVGADGVVYQKDLGRKTEALGSAMQEYNVDSSWQKAE
jgi:hypothetical protein